MPRPLDMRTSQSRGRDVAQGEHSLAAYTVLKCEEYHSSVRHIFFNHIRDAFLADQMLAYEQRDQKLERAASPHAPVRAHRRHNPKKAGMPVRTQNCHEDGRWKEKPM